MEKIEIEKIILEYLKSNNNTQHGDIMNAVENVMKSKGLIGNITTGNAYYSITQNVKIPNKESLLINDIVYDLIVERILTPGCNRDNLEWPFLHISDTEKLDKKLSALR